jgi:hypothetical protein
MGRSGFDDIMGKDRATVFKKEHPTRLFRLGFELDHQASAAPKLNGVIDDKALRLNDCLGIVGANQRFEPGKGTLANAASHRQWQTR